ncbi:molybdopterin-dependent oxidoreductase [Dinghuibacter silviterrae]|uniref:DMSO/TMAO reductase YedYZ molybdopterin-dependent catalytic subunit n=1 Tax=Dinghuibacter silviterrae TaxID=1539049 RepID=A0A4R8DVM6_9BACT|nr:molybdopterin-dependent oxidoreductase [Dinghuibacter silviterrae]TDX01978.1 DMSO/TMAO reductase YedYZ molybdopterin-dependent catalytic subunit [Dinghuibacter silviterrae]
MPKTTRIKEKHPLAIRWFHWVNFPILFLMIWSGLLIYWGNDVYSITLFGHTYVRFFPEWIYRLLHIPFRLAEGMAFHFLFMWVFFINGLLYVLYTAFSGEWRELLPNRHSFREAWAVLLHDLHLRHSLPPQGKFNAAQRIAYSGIIVMGLGSILTGLAIYKPVQLYWLCWLCGGYHVARIIHFILTLGYCVFFVVHVVQVILAGWNNFRAMVVGFEVVREKPGAGVAPAALSDGVAGASPAAAAAADALPASPAPPDAAPANANALAAAHAATPPAPPVTEPSASAAPPAAHTATPPVSGAATPSAPHDAPLPAPRPAFIPEGFSVQDSALRRRAFLSFGVFAGVGLAGFGLWKWLYDAPMETPSATKGARGPLRAVLNTNERIFRGIFSNGHPVRTYPKSEAVHPNRVRFTGNFGLSGTIDPAQWRLEVQRLSGTPLAIGIDELKTLPRTEITYMFKCIEGWDQVSNWAGVRFSDFVAHFGLEREAALDYIGFSTPDDAYYVGIDRASALHPQTLLAYEMKGRPLTMPHGAPLRLIIPVKYGIKNLKRIGHIKFSNQRPADYWAEQGYDYYAGL